MRFFVGKALEALAISLVLLGLVIGLSEEGGLHTELRLALVAVPIFVLGWWTESGSRG